MSIWTRHPRATDNPQGYWEHGLFAGRNSLIIIFAGFVGLIHAALPFLFPFFTSTVIIRSFKKLVDSGRHERELLREAMVGRDLIDIYYAASHIAAQTQKNRTPVKAPGPPSG